MLRDTLEKPLQVVDIPPEAQVAATATPFVRFRGIWPMPTWGRLDG
jgi:hypothetical protein